MIFFWKKHKAKHQNFKRNLIVILVFEFLAEKLTFQVMRRAAVILVCLAGAMVFNTVSRANDSLPPGNPYGSIVKRNVFGLNPVPVVDPNVAPPGPPPPKITLTGITTIFGPAEALFKVAGVKREGKPPQDESYIFTEGESQDDVEVTAIDTVKKIVTFNNNGVVQEIPLTAGIASGGGSAPSQPGFASPRPFGRQFGRPGFGGPDGGPGNLGWFSGRLSASSGQWRTTDLRFLPISHTQP